MTSLCDKMLKIIKECEINNDFTKADILFSEKLNECEDLNKIDINLIFNDLCFFGNVTTALWLYNHGNINIHSYGNSAFLYACMKGNIEVIILLESIGFDMRSDIIIDGVNIAKKHGHNDIVKFINGI